MTSVSQACHFDGTDRWPQALKDAFDSLEVISIDFAVMEKASEVRCVSSTFFWTDVGGWLALRDFLPIDSEGNAHRGGIATLDAAENIVFCDDPDEEVMLIGIRDLVIVRTGNKTLVVHKDRTQEIKELLRKRQDLK
jgi:mannose-1-phosphate guanylyltransferase